MTAKTDLAWAAGFIDGEGHIGFYHTRAGGGYGRISVITAQVDRRPLVKLQKALGGKVRGPYYSKQKNRRPYYQWQAVSATANDALALVYPYLTVKRDQARVALAALRKYNQLPRGSKRKLV